MPNSQPSATPADDSALRRACAEAVQELRAARVLLAKQDIELQLQAELLQIERQISDGLKNLRTLDASERKALTDALAAKDRVIAAYESEIVVLKKNRWSWWRAAKVFVFGAAAGVVAGVIVANK